MQIECESPAIILNPHLRDLVLSNRNYYFNGHRYEVTDKKMTRWFENFPYSMFSSVKHRIQSSVELDNYYIVDSLGECIPMFIQVPCGHCVLCRERKASEWVTRAMCETQTSTNIPYFITLTYNNLCLPKNGVRKRSVQLFLKRLRINLERFVGHKCNLRFFLCAEYGSKFHRPHYHALLWNVPHLDSVKEIHDDMLQQIIQRSWSFMISKERYDKLPSDKDKFGHPIYKYYDKDNKRHRALYGYTQCSECNENGVRYAMKYMRKDSDIPNGCNDVFFLSSRRRGLGFEWINEHVHEFRDNPSICDVSLTDKFTGQSFNGCIPRYFRDIISPSISRIIPKNVRDDFRYYNWLYNKACSMIGYMYTPNSRVLSHYPTLHYHLTRLPNVVNEHLSLYSGLYDNDNYSAYTRQLFKLCDALEYKLLQFEYDVDLAEYSQEYKQRHSVYVERFVLSRSPLDVSSKACSIKRRWLRSKQSQQAKSTPF